MSWASNRVTTRAEDAAYCLFGLFEVFLAPSYGEGESYAAERLKDEIKRRNEGRGTASLQDLKGKAAFTPLQYYMADSIKAPYLCPFRGMSSLLGGRAS